MCTLTIIPLRGGFRLVTNRDESRTRARATPPRAVRVGGVSAAWPVDPAGGGTWVAVSGRGLALSVLNLNERPARELERRADDLSRGLLIPELIGAESAERAASALAERELVRFMPFTLIAADARRLVSARWDRERLEVSSRSLGGACFVSSGLGDALVADRLPLFAELVASRGWTADSQDAFHAHRWPERPERSVLMSREDARTVSRTVVEVDSRCASLRYEDLVDGAASSIGLERAPSPGAGAAQSGT